MEDTLSDKIQSILKNQGAQVTQAQVTLKVNAAIDDLKKLFILEYALLDGSNFDSTGLKTAIQAMITAAKMTAADFTSLSNKAVITDSNGKTDIDVVVPEDETDNAANAEVVVEINKLDPLINKFSASLSQAYKDGEAAKLKSVDDALRAILAVHTEDIRLVSENQTLIYKRLKT